MGISGVPVRATSSGSLSTATTCWWVIKVRCRDLLVQICDAEDVRILKGVVSKDHVHMLSLIHISEPTRPY